MLKSSGPGSDLKLGPVLRVPGCEAPVSVAGVELILRPPAEVTQQRRGLEDVEETPGGRVPEHHETRAVADDDLVSLQGVGDHGHNLARVLLVILWDVGEKLVLSEMKKFKSHLILK